jgi:hypothetical protein
MKSQAVLVDGAGMPGASGDANVYGVPTAPLRAKLPGEVPWRRVDGLSPTGGSGTLLVVIAFLRSSPARSAPSR